MPYWKKIFNEKQAVYYPRAIAQGKPVTTETIAHDLAKISTVSNSDVQAVLGDIAGVMHTRISQGKSVYIKGLGYFRYVLSTKGVKDLKDFDFAKQVQAVRVEFIPERSRQSNGSYTRALVDSEQLEWIELAPTPKTKTPHTAVAAAMKARKKTRWGKQNSPHWQL
ncbi:MAG: DNA-binding protein [Bacteroides sp.]|nr:DNA-binding protein [Bacteroides sp.]